jgi:RND family efflux transporter MFP subunit
MKRAFGCGMGCLVLLLLVGGGFWVWRGTAAAPQATNNQTYTVTKGDLTVDVSESGAIEPVRVVEIKSKVSGRVANFLVDEGDFVRQNQLLGNIDPREIQQQVEQGSAQVESAQASTRKAEIAIDLQRKETQNQLYQAQNRVYQLEKELQVQPRLTQAGLKSAQMAAENAQKSLQLLREVKHPQERVEVENALRDTQARRDEAKRNLERYITLLEKGYVAQQQVDALKTQLVSAESALASAQKRTDQLNEQQRLEAATAEANLEAANAELDRARANTVQDELKREAYHAALSDLRTAESRMREIRMRELDLVQARAGQKQAESGFRNLKIQFSETEVISPINGVVTRRYREIGELVMSGTAGFGEGTPILQVADLSQMRVRLSLNELDVSKVSRGMRVEVKADAAPKRTYSGVVHKISPAAQQNIQNQNPFGASVVKYTVEVYLNNPDAHLKPGMTARCRIITTERKNALLLPLEAVGEEGNSHYVMKLEPGSRTAQGAPTTTKVPVKVGIKSATQYEILSGVQEGNTVAKVPFSGPARRQFEMDGGGEGNGGERRREEN